MRVVNVTKEKCDVRIHRKKDGTIPDPPEEHCLGNPFYLQNVEDDDLRAKVITQYKEYFYKRLEEPEFKSYVLSLKGNLGCFCAPKPCHGDVILEYIESQNGVY